MVSACLGFQNVVGAHCAWWKEDWRGHSRGRPEIRGWGHLPRPVTYWMTTLVLPERDEIWG